MCLQHSTLTGHSAHHGDAHTTPGDTEAWSRTWAAGTRVRLCLAWVEAGKDWEEAEVGVGGCGTGHPGALAPPGSGCGCWEP